MSTQTCGLGVQGLADVFAMLKIGFDSEEAKEVNRRIFETIYLFIGNINGNFKEKRKTDEKIQGIMFKIIMCTK